MSIYYTHASYFYTIYTYRIQYYARTISYTRAPAVLNSFFFIYLFMAAAVGVSTCNAFLGLSARAYTTYNNVYTRKKLLRVPPYDWLTIIYDRRAYDEWEWRFIVLQIYNTHIE